MSHFRPNVDADLARMTHFSEITQVSIITPDREATVDVLHAALGPGGFKMVTFGPPELFDQTYAGQPEAWSFDAALTWIGDMQLEVIQPHLHTRSVYADYLKLHGDRAGIEHIFLQRRTGSLDDAIDALSEAGIGWRQGARMNAAGRLGRLPLPAMPSFLAKKYAAHFGYTSSQDALKVDLELASFPPGVSQRFALRAAIPERWVPAKVDPKHFEGMPDEAVLRDIFGVGLLVHNLAETCKRYERLTDKPLVVRRFAGDPFAGQGEFATIGFATSVLHLIEPHEGPLRAGLDRWGEGVRLLQGQVQGGPEALREHGWTHFGSLALHPDVPFALATV
ncbi:MAG: hypothetical protein AAGA56_10130 [Myxococcota bacterium]